MREQDTYKFQTARLKRVLAERAPGKEISFDDTRSLIHFRVVDPATGTELVKAIGEWIPSELADKSDDELWAMVRSLSNGKL